MTSLIRLLPATALSIALIGCAADASDPHCVGPCTGGPAQDLEIATVLPEVCTSPEVIRITRPVVEGDPSDTFQYGFRFRAPSAAGAPVLVYLPGGPGQGSMDQAPEFIPEGWGYLMTDPRGVGCNRFAALPTAETSGAVFVSRELANDVIAAIEDRALTNYVLFGVSYGTLLATTVAHELEARHLQRPASVVLEGVLGRAFGMDFAGAEFLTQWDRVHAVLPSDLVTELDTAASPYGLTPEGWSRVLMAVVPRGPGPTANILAGLAADQPEQVQRDTLAALQELASSGALQAPGEIELYRQIACRELLDTVPANDLDVVFQAGRLVRNRSQEGTKCGDLHVTQPYDSAKLPFASPLYLFIGDSDVATPAWQGAYHFEHHTGSAARVITINGGHNSLELNQLDCAPQLMASIARGGADLPTVAATCPMQTTIDRK